MKERVDVASRNIQALPSEVFGAFATQEKLQAWLPPAGMEGELFGFEFREGGGYRMRLTYTAAQHVIGKTTEHSDEVTVRFVRIVPCQRIEQLVTFDSEREEFAGEMRMTWVFERRSTGTDVQVSCTNVPRGIQPEDHEVGLAASLENLADIVESGNRIG